MRTLIGLVAASVLLFVVMGVCIAPGIADIILAPVIVFAAYVAWWGLKPKAQGQRTFAGSIRRRF